MTIIIASRRKKPATILQEHPGAVLVDVTSKGEKPWVKFSPFFPHYGIPIPMSPGRFGATVEGIWQGLKVFENADVDHASFTNDTMKDIKRTVRSNGPVRGHRAGIDGKELLRTWKRG